MNALPGNGVRHQRVGATHCPFDDGALEEHCRGCCTSIEYRLNARLFCISLHNHKRRRAWPTGHFGQNTCANSQYSEPDNSIAAGNVSTQASPMLRSVRICRPEPFAAIVPATPDESTCVVETGRP